MALLFHSDHDSADDWCRALADRLPGLDIRVSPDDGAVEDIQYALVWHPPAGMLARYPNLEVILSLGAGVDHIFADPDLPADVPIVRLVDAGLTARMTEYVLLHVLGYHRQHGAYARAQRARRWQPLAQPAAADRRIGIMGLGVLGKAAARPLVDLGFDVAGWSRTAQPVAGVTAYDAGHLDEFLARTDILVCLLPLTPQTRGILNRATLAKLPAGASLINAGRGGLLVEDDLIAALDGGLAAATLDVFAVEPLAADHEFWGDERITVTPHVASATDPRSAADEVAKAIAAIRDGRHPDHTVGRARGY